MNQRFQLTNDDERTLLHWFFVANATGHYSRGSSETLLDADLSILLRRDGGPRELIDLVKQRFGRIRFSAADFAGRSARNPLFQTAYLAIKHAGAKDWRSGLGLSLTHTGKYHYIQTHHIFPKALMHSYESSEINEIANLAFISGGQNRTISSKSPEVYFPEIVGGRGIEALQAQGIPIDPSMWKVENFRTFLEYRRAELARMVNMFLEGAANEGSSAMTDIADIISEGEGPSLEFKETARVNVRTGTVDKVMGEVVVKTVAGFLNSQGGILIVGVNDAGMPVGINRDLATLTKKNLDGYELFLRSLLNTSIGVDMCAHVRIEFPPVDGTHVCVLRVPAAPRVVWVNGGSGKVLYIRSGNSTQLLDSEAAYRYISSHFDMGI